MVGVHFRMPRACSAWPGATRGGFRGFAINRIRVRVGRTMRSLTVIPISHIDLRWIQTCREVDKDFKTCCSTQSTSSSADSHSCTSAEPNNSRHHFRICNTDRNPFGPGFCREDQHPDPPILRRPSSRMRQEGLRTSHHFQNALTKSRRFVMGGWRLGARGRRFQFQMAICSGRWLDRRPEDW